MTRCIEEVSEPKNVCQQADTKYNTNTQEQSTLHPRAPITQ